MWETLTAINDLFTAGQFFLVIAAELIILFIGISFLVGLIREYVPEEKIRSSLKDRKYGVGNILGAGLGALTPFCSCSTIPILVGLLDVGIPFGIAYSYLIASPPLNPVIVLLLLALFGIAPTLVYFAITFTIAVISGILLERAGYARYVMGRNSRQPRLTRSGSSARSGLPSRSSGRSSSTCCSVPASGPSSTGSFPRI